MADDELDKRPKQPFYFPSIPPKAPLQAQSYSKSVQEAPYRALSGIVPDGKIPERHPESPRCRVRRQTGLTNRWRLPESLYGDLLGTSQALKAINMPFNQSLVETITGRFVAHNPMLGTCSRFAHMKESNWSLLAKQSTGNSKPGDDELSNS